MGRITFALLLALFCFPKNSAAYVRTMSSSGIPVHWASPALSVSLNPTNSSGLTTNQVSTLIGNAFSSWVNADSAVSYTLATSTSSPTAANQGVNAVYFSSNSGTTLDYGIVAVTQVLYYVSSGQIASFGMQFNDNQFMFTANVGDTGTIINGRTAIYLQDVATHEAGHAYGFDHSTVGKSTLIYSAFSGQFTLGDDDITAINTVYPSSSGGGSITGTVEGLNGGIFGTHVMAINQSTGNVQAGTLANPDGTFTIGNIPAGDYVVMMEPLETSSSTISAYYQNIYQQFCGYSKFRRSFYSACGSGVATTVAVQNNEATAIGTLSPSCNQMGNPGGAPTSLANAKSFPSNGGAMFGTLLSAGDVHYYKVPNISGALSAYAMAYTLYSPADILIDILDSNGNAVGGATSIDNVQNPMPGGHINYDSSASASNLASGNYYIRVRANTITLSSNNYPAGSDMLDSSAHYLLLVGVNSAHGTAAITDMGSCISVNNIVQGATISAGGGGSQSQTSGGGCGMIQGPGGPGGPGGGSFLNSSLAMILFTAAATKLAQALARKRS